LDYSKVYRLCQHFPECDFWLNGGIATLAQASLICYGTKSGSKTEECAVQVANIAVTPIQSGQQHGRIPCLLCQAPNGSCVAPPLHTAPPNLRGCMIGRAAMDNPAIFGNVDCYFYGETSNPSRNRRQVLERYCDYLEKRYPPRCSDDDAQWTAPFPSPSVVPHLFIRCLVCEWHATDVCRKDPDVLASFDGCLQFADPKVVKISSYVVDRALKPVLGMFFGMPGTKTWRRACYELSRDVRIRNCGPAFILRQAVKRMSDELLDLQFCEANHF
jgi:hypothetical protein